MTVLRRSNLPAITLLLAALWALLMALPAAAEPVFPKLSGRVTDAAGVLPPETVAALEGKLKALEDSTGTQLVVATVPDLQGYEIDEYGYQLGRAWGIGQKGTNTGAILLVAPAQRKLRIEVGYGLEGVLTDAVSSRIVRQTMCVSASIESFDDSLEHVSVNTGETATFICDLPERFSNKQVGILLLVYHPPLSLSTETDASVQ